MTQTIEKDRVSLIIEKHRNTIRGEYQVTLRPLGRRVLIAPVARPTQTASGLVLPERANTVDVEGTVIAVGPDVRSVRVDSRVLFSWQAGQEVHIGSTRYLVLPETDVLAVLESDATQMES